MTDPATDPVRVLHVTDPHLFAEADSSLRGAVTYITLSSVVADIQQQNWPADLLAVTGDIIQDDSAAAYQHFCELVIPVGLPVLCVPGNHDVRSLMQDALSEPPFYYCESVQLGNWLITGIDSCIEDDAGGRIASSELARLEKILSTASAEHVAVFLHHPPVPLGSKWLDQVGLHNSDEFLNLITNSSKVRATFSGHAHQQFDKEHGAIRLIGSPSTCRQFLPRSDEFALDDLPPAYRQVSLNPDGSVDTELIWVSKDE